jgi:hypothetical protein
MILDDNFTMPPCNCRIFKNEQYFFGLEILLTVHLINKVDW